MNNKNVFAIGKTFSKKYGVLSTDVRLRIDALGDDRKTVEGSNVYIYAEDGVTHIGSLIKDNYEVYLASDLSMPEFKAAVGLGEKEI